MDFSTLVFLLFCISAASLAGPSNPLGIPDGDTEESDMGRLQGKCYFLFFSHFFFMTISLLDTVLSPTSAPLISAPPSFWEMIGLSNSGFGLNTEVFVKIKYLTFTQKAITLIHYQSNTNV